MQEKIRTMLSEYKIRSRKFKRTFLIDLLNENKIVVRGNTVAQLIDDRLAYSHKNIEHFQMTFKFKGRIYTVTYIVLDNIAFNIDLTKYKGKDIRQYIDELVQKEIDFDELVCCRKVSLLFSLFYNMKFYLSK